MTDPFGLRIPERKRIRLRVCEPDGGWFARLICAVWVHKIAPSPDEAMYVYDLNDNLQGMVCERCGGLI